MVKTVKSSLSPIPTDQVELIRRDYVANQGWETFLSYEDPQQGVCVCVCVCVCESSASYDLIISCTLVH